MMFKQSNSRNTSYSRTYKRVRRHLLATNSKLRRDLANELSSKRGIRARFRKSLLLYPLISFFPIAAVILLISFFTWVFARIFAGENQLVQLLAIAFFIISCLGIIQITASNTPAHKISLDEKWSEVMSLYIKTTGSVDRLDEVEAELKSAADYYKQKGKPLKIIMLAGGTVLINCLSDSSFQNALMSISISNIIASTLNIIEVNYWGGMCLLVLPFMSFWYFRRYAIPIAWLENAASQIKSKKTQQHSR